MESERLHDLTAAYALDALDEDEQREYEEHLRSCARCREELAGFQETAGALAFAAGAPSPPPALRERILAQVSGNGALAPVIPLRRRRAFQAVTAFAAAAACIAIGLGIWASSLRNSLGAERQARSRLTELVADPAARRIALQGADGQLVVTPHGDAALVVRGLSRAPEGRTYEAWVIAKGAPRPAGTFAGGAGREIVLLSRRVTPGTVVAVTVERAGGSAKPTTKPFIQANTA
jgi:anti-sigma-K factor RskA